MSTVFRTCHDHAVVAFSEDLTLEAVIELVDTIDLMVDTYYYTRILLDVDSDGGLIDALDHFLSALERWRSRGVQICTGVTLRAHSAAALMVSLGDDRVAEANARLLYHCTRTYTQNVPSLTAYRSAKLYLELHKTDEDALDRLVERALKSAGTPLSTEANDSDRAVLVDLESELLPSKTQRPRTVRSLARIIGRKVRRAVREKNRQALKKIYAALFALEQPISGRLACTLRLVDRLADVQPDKVLPEGQPGLTIPEWAPLFPPSGDVIRETLGRHMLALGETGSGKTASVVLPVVRALALAPPERVGASLIVDPKHEIGPFLERLVPDRLQHLRLADVGLDLMRGPRWSLDADLAAGHWLRAATKILSRVAGFVPSSAVRVLVDHEASIDSNHEFFDREGTSLLTTVLAFVLMVIHRDAPPLGDWLDEGSREFNWMEALLDRADGHDGARGPNVMALASYALESVLVSPPEESVVIPETEKHDPSRKDHDDWFFAKIARRAHRVWSQKAGEGRDVLQQVLHYWTPMAEIDRQYAGVLATARSACSDFAESRVADTLYFGCEPGAAAAGTGSCDFARAVSAKGDGRILLFQPSRDGLDNMIAKALKATFFEAIFNDPDRAGGAADLPLVGYVADEFHRFVTSDRVHGEPSFLDACRSYGVFCVLACQSVASLEHTMAHAGGGLTVDRAAVSILWTNTGSKFFFRSTDPMTVDRVEDLCPYRPGLAAVTRVRPLSTLVPGECYASITDGRFERRQLEPVLPHGVKRARSGRDRSC